MNDINLYYLLICSSSLFIGLLFLKDKIKSVSLFLCLGLIIPTSHQFMFLTSYKGVYFFDYYFFILIIFFLINVNYMNLKDWILNNKTIIFLFSSLIIYHSFLIYINDVVCDKYLLRDFRPFLLLISGIVFINLLKDIKIQSDLIINILQNALILKLVFFIILFLINPFQDVYYQKYIYRYRDGVTFVAAIFLIIYLFRSKLIYEKTNKFKIHIILLISILLLIISNLRALVPPLLFIYLFIHKTNTQNLFKKIVTSACILSLFIFYTKYMPVIINESTEKVKKINSVQKLNIEQSKDLKISYKLENKSSIQVWKKITSQFTNFRYKQLFQNPVYELNKRFLPASKYFNEIRIKEFFLGYGISSFFEIKHFEYRGLDTKNNSMDSLYLTFFIKYGFIGLAIIFILFIRILIINIKINRLKLSIIIFFLSISVTSSLLYHPGAIVYIIFINLFAKSLKHESTSRSLHITS
tara:strand:+ start:379 stop:1785 length:1407 start_codon:yes stop_codon:yes gene_type:complete